MFAFIPSYGVGVFLNHICKMNLSKCFSESIDIITAIAKYKVDYKWNTGNKTVQDLNKTLQCIERFPIDYYSFW